MIQFVSCVYFTTLNSTMQYNQHCVLVPLLPLVCVCCRTQSQIVKESAGSPGVIKSGPPPTVPPASVRPPAQVPPVVPAAPVSEVCTHQSRPAPPLTTASTSSVSVSSPPLTPKPTSPPVQQQFTVHGQFLGSGDLCHGPAPNVTVNPLYQPPVGSEHGLTPPPRPAAPLPTAADQQIRVLTPSEIMRTLPSLCQENYDTQPPLVRNCSVSVEIKLYFDIF